MMSNNGLSKLIEECGELTQVCGKLLAYPTGDHPDGAGNLFTRLEEEMADVLAACIFVVLTHDDLNSANIESRKNIKLEKFKKWALEP